MHLTYCPFCGCEDVELKIEIDTKYVECNKCAARGPSFNISKEQIETRWNSRYQDKSPGSLLARFEHLANYTEHKFHHSPYSSKSFIGTLTSGIEQLEYSLERMIGWADKFMSEADLGDDFDFEMYAYSLDKAKAKEILKGNIDV